MNALAPDDVRDSEIRLEDIVKAVRISGRAMLVGMILTPILVYGGIHGLGKYAAEVALSNTCVKIDAKESDCGLSFGRWRMLAENLPPLASQWADQIKARGEDPKLLAGLASAPWWEKHVLPVYGVSQADSKKFPLMDDRLKGESTRISLLKITLHDRKPARARQNLEWTVRFLRDGASFLELRTLLDGYQSEATVTAAGIAEQRLNAEVETGYAKARLATIESILARDDKTATHEQVRVDVGNVDPTYLPLRTQANALKVSLYQYEEKLRRLKDQETQMAVLSAFLGEAVPALGTDFHGQATEAMHGHLMAIRDRLESETPPEDLARRFALERIRADLTRIQARYTVQLAEIASQMEPPRAGLPVLAGSAFAGLILGFMWAFGRHKLREYHAAEKRI